MTRAEAQDKIRKLLTLAGAAGTEGEALAAMSAAQKLMSEHALSPADAAASDPEAMERIQIFEAEGKYLPSHLLPLAHVCGEVNGVFTSGSGKTIVAYGHPSTIAMVAAMFARMRTQVDKLAEASKVARGKAGKRAFRFGCVERISERLQETRKAAEQEAAAQIAALPAGPVREVRETTLAVYRGLLSKAESFRLDWLKQTGGKPRTRSSAGTADAGARAAGYVAGGQVAFTSRAALK